MDLSKKIGKKETEESANTGKTEKPKKQKSHAISAFVSFSKKQQVDAKAKELGFRSTSQFLNRLVDDSLNDGRPLMVSSEKKIKKSNKVDFKDMIVIRNLGSNLNQISRKLNTISDYVNISRELPYIQEQIKNLILTLDKYKKEL